MDSEVGHTRGQGVMHLSGSNYGMPRLSLAEALAFHAVLGLDAMELTVLPGYVTALENVDRRAARDQFRQHGIMCSGVANFQTLTDPETEQSALVMARHRGAVELAVELALAGQQPLVVFMSGGAVSDWPAVRDRLVERVAQLAAFARGHGVILAMKAHANGAVSRPHHLVELFEQVGPPAFRFCFDMSHFEVQGLSIQQAMYPLLALSAHAEVKASIGRAPDQEYMIPGETGTQSDFAGQFEAMRTLGYRGYLVPEMSVHVMRRPNYDPYAALRLSTDTLRALLSEATGRAARSGGVPR